MLMCHPRLMNLDSGCLWLRASSYPCLPQLGYGMMWVWPFLHAGKAAYHG